jgi:hypothetical protein
LLLWSAYQAAARCFGALMLVIWLDFCDDRDLSPTPAKQQLFSQIHRPQFYLGGLPLAFFFPSQLIWFLATARAVEQ